MGFFACEVNFIYHHKWGQTGMLRDLVVFGETENPPMGIGSSRVTELSGGGRGLDVSSVGSSFGERDGLSPFGYLVSWGGVLQRGGGERDGIRA